jgi:hypothetical protein
MKHILLGETDHLNSSSQPSPKPSKGPLSQSQAYLIARSSFDAGYLCSTVDGVYVISVEATMVEEKEKKRDLRTGDIIVASHDSIFPIERVKLTRAVGHFHQIHNACNSVHHDTWKLTSIVSISYLILLCDGHHPNRDFIVIPPTNPQWQPPLRISPPRNLSPRTIAHAHQSQTHRRDRTPVCLRRSCLQATAVEAQIAWHAPKTAAASEGVCEVARDDRERAPASETGQG